MIVNALLAILLALIQTPAATPDSETANVFVDLGAEHCAQELAITAFENTEAAELAAADAPALVTYSAFQFEDADQANAALDDAHTLVAQTFSDDPAIADREDFDELVTEVETEEFGDRTSGHIMNLPVADDGLDAISINMMGIVKESQLVLVMMFGEGSEGDSATPGLSAEAILPFVELLDENWDGTGDIAEAIPAQDQMPIGWESRETTSGEPPACE